LPKVTPSKSRTAAKSTLAASRAATMRAGVDQRRSSRPVNGLRRASASEELMPGVCLRCAPAALPGQLEDELQPVLLVPLVSGLDEPELADDRERRGVRGGDRGDEVPDLVLALGPIQQRGGGLARVSMAPERGKDGVA